MQGNPAVKVYLFGWHIYVGYVTVLAKYRQMCYNINGRDVSGNDADSAEHNVNTVLRILQPLCRPLCKGAWCIFSPLRVFPQCLDNFLDAPFDLLSLSSLLS